MRYIAEVGAKIQECIKAATGRRPVAGMAAEERLYPGVGAGLTPSCPRDHGKLRQNGNAVVDSCGGLVTFGAYLG